MSGPKTETAASGQPRPRSTLLTLVLWVLSTALFAWLFIRFANTDAPLQIVFLEKQWELLQPRALGLGLLVPTLIIGTRTSLADLPPAQGWLATLARSLFLGTLAVALARPVATTTSERVAAAYLVDVSDSASEENIEAARAAIVQAQASKRPDDVVSVIAFANHARVVPLAQDGAVADAATLRRLAALEAEPAVSGDAPARTAPAPTAPAPTAPAPTAPPATATAPADDKASAGQSQTAETRIDAALRLAYASLPSDHIKRVVVFSDGVETGGDFVAEAARAAAANIHVHVVPYRAPPPAEVAIVALDAPAKASIGEPFRLRASVYATRATTARAKLLQDAQLNGLSGIRNDIELQQGTTELVFDSVVRVGGEVTYRLELDQIGADRFTANNHFETKIDVPSRPLILYVDSQPERATYLSSALSAQQFDVEVRTTTAFPTSLAELERYALVLLSDVPEKALGVSSQALLERYVKDLGGGLIFAGGTQSYGPGGWANSPLERILPVRMDAEKRKDMPSVAMALVIDHSGSMEGLPLEMAKAACNATVATLKPDDLVEVIAFDSEPTRYVRLQPARYRARIQGEIARIQPSGGTAIFPALDAAYQDIAVARARRKHVILLTDGQASRGGIADLVQAMIAESITVTTVGLGSGADTTLLRMIADAGGGRFHQVPDPNNLPRIFTHETELVTRQSAVVDWFPVVQTQRADFLSGISVATAPLLRGYTSTQLKPAPAQQILASDTGEPILARWRVGLGYAVAWTSDVKNNWAIDWLRWDNFGRFWGQLVREHMRKQSRRELKMRTEIVGQSVRAWVDAFTQDEDFDKTLLSTLRVTGPDADSPPLEMPMKQVAPGRYAAEFDLPGFGSFTLKGTHSRELEDGQWQRYAESFGQVSLPYPVEYRSFQSDFERLAQAASMGQGELDPLPSAVFNGNGEKLLQYKEYWPFAVGAALLLLLFDLLLRRVRLLDRHFQKSA